MNDSERFGKDLADFLRGFLNNSSPSVTAPKTEIGDWATPPDSSVKKKPEDSWNNSTTPATEFPPDFELWADFNNAHKLIPGNLLVVHLGTNRVFQVDIKTGDPVFMFSLNWGQKTFPWRAIADVDGHIYCSMSGTLASTHGHIPAGYRAPAAKFDYWGAIVKINHREGTLKVLAETKVPGQGLVRDPHGMQLLANGKLLVCDFQGFGGGGAVYTVDKDTGETEAIIEGGLLNQTPVSALLDTDNVLWVANADMSDQNDGEIIRIDLATKKQTVFLKRGGKNKGQVVGVLQAPKKDELIVFRCEWPNIRGNGAVFLLNKKTGKTTDLFNSSTDDPRFPNTNGDVTGNILWFGESVRKEIIGYDILKRKIVSTFDFRGVAGGWRGMIDSYDGIESVTVIPDGIRQ